LQLKNNQLKKHQKKKKKKKTDEPVPEPEPVVQETPVEEAPKKKKKKTKEEQAPEPVVEQPQVVEPEPVKQPEPEPVKQPEPEPVKQPEPVKKEEPAQPKLARRASQIHKLNVLQGKVVEPEPKKEDKATPKQIFVDELDDIINSLEDQDQSLTTLDFADVSVPFKDIHVDQLQDLAEMWGQNETVTTASLKDKQVNNVVVSYLFPQLGANLTLEDVDVSGNPLIDDGAIKVFEGFITKTKTVTKLDLSGCSFTEKGKKLLQAAKQKNTKLELIL